MTTEIQAIIKTSFTSDIPRIGQRKRVLVNGKFEHLYVNHLSIQRFEDYETGKRRDVFRAKVTYGPFAL